MSDKMKTIKDDLVKAFSTGVSYMMPVVVVGGICLALSLVGGEPTPGKGIVVTNPFLLNLGAIGSAGLGMMIPVLAAYIAYSLAGKPGLTPGLVTGFMAATPLGEAHVVTGFLGAMLLGILSGYVAKWVKTWKVGKVLMPVMPILIIPIVTSCLVGMLYLYVLIGPIGMAMKWLVSMLSNMQGGSGLVLGLILGAMAAFDMGGPVNKTATAFTLALMAEGIYGPNGAYRIACAIPPLGIALSTFISRNKWAEDEKRMGTSAAFMGLIGITEGAIPFAVKNLKTVLPSIIIGSAVGAGLAMIHGVESMVPHGGLIAIAGVNKGAIWYVIDMAIGVIVTAICLHILRPNISDAVKNETVKKTITSDMNKA
ncbi:MAG: PTS fructose transporter subunit IIC [Pantoea sp.]|uniref:PTS fructose transporter subunit IIA n=1 Tax=Pantoea phytobeneficialis TaxID=2052056 RepID=A0AAP9KSE0_9GAMM|nr:MULTISPECIES: PTS fructose transporter subunit IIC [Pantoea]ERK08960.1 PTS system, mannose-specific IIB component [Pantoea sp. AS-PWVM4]MDO6407055.1 PTS fructose transporter subunit IIC [Pantoea phytobeneficialis]QGR10015.1 PTS fructose transporter subunit IIA [Pantoea phytobeneficialis]